jgi:hypothetical protein
MTLARTPFKPRTKPMSRGKSPKATAGLLRVAAVQREGKTKAKGLKASRPRMTPIRKAARNQDCTLQFPGICNRDPATTVLCHSNSLADGKGMGLKAPDEKACFGCSACHDLLDGRRPRPNWLSRDAMQTQFYYAVERTHDVLRALGLISGGSAVAPVLPPKQISLEQ